MNVQEKIKEIENEMDKYKIPYKIYTKLFAVKEVKSGKSRTEVAEYLHTHRITVGKWVKSYDENGINGLMPKYENCGLKCRLNDEQLSILKEILNNSEKNYTLKDIQKIIEEEFNIHYSLKQVWVITQEKLELNYNNPPI